MTATRCGGHTPAAAALRHTVRDGLRERARPTVVLLHSSAASSRQWDALAALLRLDCDVHAIDLHGHGGQPPWHGERALTLQDEAALALPVMEAAGGAHLIGHSYGAAVALHLAVARPTLVRSLALYEPVVFALLDEHEPNGAAAAEVREVAQAMRRLTADGWPQAAAACFVDYWSGAMAWSRLDARQQRSITSRMPLVVQHFDAAYAAALPAQALARLCMPLLCLTGGRSTAAARRIGQLLRRGLPGGQHQTLAGAGHMGPLTHAELVNQRLLRFIGAVMPLMKLGRGVVAA